MEAPRTRNLPHTGEMRPQIRDSIYDTLYDTLYPHHTPNAHLPDYQTTRLPELPHITTYLTTIPSG